MDSNWPSIVVCVVMLLVWLAVLAQRSRQIAAINRELEQRRDELESQFDRLFGALQSHASNYTFYALHQDGVWLETDFEKFEAAARFSYQPRKLSDYSRHGSRRHERVERDYVVFDYRVDESSKRVRLVSGGPNLDIAAIDWSRGKYFEDWAVTETSVDRAIDDYKARKALEARSQPPAKWWEFWKVG